MRKTIAFIVFVIFLAPFVVRAGYDTDFMRGYNFPAWWHDAYSRQSTDHSLAAMIADGGASWVAVGPFWYQKDIRATTMYANKNRTVSDAGVEHIIMLAHEKGLQVLLKPSVDAENGEWRGTFQPNDVDAWFKSYTAMAVHYATMAERLKVEAYLIGAEYVTLSGPQYADRWRAVVRAVREKYKGDIGYGANWDDQKGTPEFEHVTWWDAVDFIGIHAYFPLSKKNDATLADMMDGIAPWVERVETAQKRYQKPIIFTEAGYKSCDGGTRIPWWCNPKAKADAEEQSNGAEAVLKAFYGKPWFKGIFWWLWTIEPDGYKTTKEHDLNKKPALTVIKKYWFISPQKFTETMPSKNVPPLLGGEGKGEVTKTSDLSYGKPRLSAKEEKQWEKKMWNGIKKSFRNRQPKLKPGEWTYARLAYTYGSYPMDVIRESLHYGISTKYPAPFWLLKSGQSCDAPKTCGIHPSIPWTEWKVK